MDKTFNSQKKEIESIIHQIIQGWLVNRIRRFEDYFDDDIGLTIPADNINIKGKKYFINYHEQYLKDKKIKRYDEIDFSVRVEKDYAIAHYSYNLEYEKSNIDYRECGRDIFIYKYNKNNWKLVWRIIYAFNNN